MPKGYKHTLRSILDNTAWIPECGCRLWLGPINNAGYGQVPHECKKRLVHRLVKMMELGRTLSPKEEVLHKCDTKLCCNPAHLFVGSQSDNIQDMLRKGRGRPRYGTQHPRARCSPEIVNKIRVLQSQGHAMSAITDMVGMSYQIVRDVCTSRTWRHIPKET